MGIEGCPACGRDHENHSVWLMSDDSELDDAVNESRKYPSVTLNPVKGDVTAWNTPHGRVILVTPKEDVKMGRDYEDFEVVTGWDSDSHYGESVEFPTYTTLYKDIETGLLVIDKDAFENWISSLRGRS